MKARFWVLTAALLPLCGCETNLEFHVKDLGAAKLPANWQLTANKEEGVSVGVPPGWKSGVGTSAGFATFLTEGVESKSNGQPKPQPQPQAPADPQADKFMSDLNAAANEEKQAEADDLRSKHGIILQVVNAQELALPWAQQTRFFVKKVDQGHNASMDEAVQEEIKFMGGGMKPERVQLPIGEARRLEGTTTSGRGQTLNRIAYVVVDGHSTFILRFIGVDSAASVKAIERQVAESLRIKPSK